MSEEAKTEEEEIMTVKRTVKNKTGTTVDMPPDVRMRLGPAPKPATVVAPKSDTVYDRVPDVDDNHLVNQGIMGAMPVKPLQSEGQFARRGAIKGVMSSTSSEEEDQTPEQIAAKYHQVITLKEAVKAEPEKPEVQHVPSTTAEVPQQIPVLLGFQPNRQGSAEGPGAFLKEHLYKKKKIPFNAPRPTFTPPPRPPVRPSAAIRHLIKKPPTMTSFTVRAHNPEHMHGLKTEPMRRGQGDTLMWIDPGTGAPEAEKEKNNSPRDGEYGFKAGDVGFKTDDEEKMDVSVLRLDDTAQVDISLGNLSDTQVVEEHPEVEEAKTEQILEQMGNEPGVFSLCDSIENLLAAGGTPRPGVKPRPCSTSPETASSKPSPAYSSRASYSNMPSLTSSEISGDSGSSPPQSDQEDTVKVNFERKDLITFIFELSNISFSRLPIRTLAKVTSGAADDRTFPLLMAIHLKRIMELMILCHQQLYLIRYLNHVLLFPGFLYPIGRCNSLLCTWK